MLIFKWLENGETPQLTKNAKTITCTMDNSVLLVVSRLSSYSSSTLSSMSRSKDQLNYSRKLVTSLDPVTTRNDKHACGKPMLTDHDKEAMENREPADEMNKEDPTQGIPVWLQPFTVNLEDLEAQCSHFPLKERTQIRKVMLQKWRHKKRKHSVHAHFRKNQKRSILRTEKYGDLTTTEHTILNEGRESRDNHRYAVVVQVLATLKSVLNQRWYVVVGFFMKCCCYLRDEQDLMADGNSKHERRFVESF